MITTAGTSYLRIEHRNRAAFLTTVETQLTSNENQSSTVLFAPHVAGICRSDLREVLGTRFGRRDFGHELVGTILTAPAPLKALEGRTVVFDPHPELTRRTSGFAEQVELTGDPGQLAAAFVPVPAGLDDPIAVFTEPLACAVHCVSRLHQVTAEGGVGPHSPVAVVGAGMAGTLICAVLTAQGHPCVLINPHPERIEFLNARHVLPSEILHTGPSGARFQRVILATAAASPEHLATGIGLLQPGGLLMLFAGTQPAASLGEVDIDRVRREQLAHPVTSENKRVTVAGTYGALHCDFLDALSLLTEQPGPTQWSLAVCVQRLTTRVLPLQGAADYLTVNADRGVLGKTLVYIRPPIPLEST
ncbi:hypothetical protein [Nocardia anaemiae]|uniref:hypothetical protein n=1 Tax=Nocardia anaemiae TaxID=263910 RepID=UPI0007A49556|nr:hypothetical protein [Nocardia anaemiae]